MFIVKTASSLELYFPKTKKDVCLVLKEMLKNFKDVKYTIIGYRFKRNCGSFQILGEYQNHSWYLTVYIEVAQNYLINGELKEYKLTTRRKKIYLKIVSPEELSAIYLIKILKKENIPKNLYEVYNLIINRAVNIDELKSILETFESSDYIYKTFQKILTSRKIKRKWQAYATTNLCLNYDYKQILKTIINLLYEERMIK